MSNKEVNMDLIMALREQLRDIEEKYLTRYGWAATSSTPDCVWRYAKEYEGKTYIVDRETALELEFYYFKR